MRLPTSAVLWLIVFALAACTNTPAATTTSPSLGAETTTTSTIPVPSIEEPSVGPGAWDPSAIPGDAVRIEVGDNAQTVVDDHPEGTSFVFASGVHRGVSITRPKPGNSFFGETGAILDGSDDTQFAIVAYDESDTVADVTVAGLVVENYAPPVQLAPVGGGGAIDWIVEFIEVRYSAAAGIQLGDGSVARRNHVHHNRQIGVKTGTPTTGVVIEDNEINDNNFEDEFEYEFEAGGMKIVNSTGVTISGNYVHSNHGPGIWTDGNNVDALITGNIARDNYGPGIFHEISYDAVITENLVERNGFEFYVGGILVASSGGVEIHGNAVLGNDGGIIAIQEDRGEGTQGEFLVDRLSIHDNLITFEEGVSGVIDQREDGEVLVREIDFRSNTYDVSGLDTPFVWGEDELTVDEWLGIHPGDG